jgi:hypothetical protein
MSDRFCNDLRQISGSSTPLFLKTFSTADRAPGLRNETDPKQQDSPFPASPKSPSPCSHGTVG